MVGRLWKWYRNPDISDSQGIVVELVMARILFPIWILGWLVCQTLVICGVVGGGHETFQAFNLIFAAGNVLLSIVAMGFVVWNLSR